MEFRERLKQLRKENMLTQRQLGSVLNYGSSAIANYESGRNEPSIRDLIRIARKFDVTTDYLVGITDTPKPPYMFCTHEELEVMSNIIVKQFFKNREGLADMIRPILRNIINENAYLAKR